MGKYGEIYTLGNHRLMCGDATNRDDVMKLVDGVKVDLVLTDPPYGIKIQSKNGSIGHAESRPMKGAKDERFANTRLTGNKYPIMQGDNSTETSRKFYEIAKAISKKFIIWGGQYFANFLPVNGGWLFWNKQTGNSDFSDGELAYTNIGKRVRMYTQLWNGVFMECDYRLNGREWVKGSKARLHPSQKPVELHMKILEDFTKPGDVILDCFGGSGTTLIACNETGRKCLMMEISPEYCDVIIGRYEKLMSEKAEKVID